MKTKLDITLALTNGLLLCFLLLTSFKSFANSNPSSRGIKVVGDTPAQFEQPTPIPIEGEYRALIIGNDNYQDPKALWNPLKRAVSDAKAVEKLLIENYGFTDVERIENVTRRELLHAFRDFSKRVSHNDNVLIYYAGHGFLDQYTSKGYWVPVDAVGTDHTTFVRNSTIRDELSDLSQRAKHTLLISDSCFSGTLLKTASRGLRVDDGSKEYLKSVSNKKSVQILTAGGVEYVDDDFRASGHSPFTYFLQSELKNNPYPVITASNLSKRVQVAVSNNVEQEPQMGVLQGAGDELGEFLFIKVNLEVSGVPKEKVKVKVNIISDTDIASKENSDADTAPTENEPKTTKKTNESVVLPVQSF